MPEKKVKSVEKAKSVSRVVNHPVNLRKKADYEAEIVKVLYTDDKIEVISEKDGWAKVADGFVRVEFLK